MAETNFLFSISNFILDILFPIKCLGCGKEFENKKPKERWVCEKCLNEIIIRKEQVCPVCEKEAEGGKTCYHCRKKTGLDGLWVASEYSDVVLSQAIRKFKFNFVKDLSYPLGKVILKSVLEQEEFGDFQDLLFARSTQNLEDDLESSIPSGRVKSSSRETIIIPVPLHRRRYNWRGFNQSELLANEIARKFNLKVNNNLLIRWRNTKPQTKIKSMAERRENIKGAFRMGSEIPLLRGGWGCIKNSLPTPPEKGIITSSSSQEENIPKEEILKNKNIIIIDDVCTTLATLNECASVIKKAGAKKVWGVVAARR